MNIYHYVELVPKNGSSYVVADGKEISRHDDVRIAELVRAELLRSLISSDSAPAADAEPTLNSTTGAITKSAAGPCEVHEQSNSTD